ncbi:hypothetical protein R0131_11020 [Clostridium sp. AL.422]|uniref:hypothetical protein n=1 Tax=Clostridium TaxID=1485 RepID=UPI00293DC8E9|nr:MULTISPECIES: hypothetical protein [unclassified Clostridium]MDV4151372.1 hypothetical protein [Clostridium sp. AL.422]
MEIDLMILFNGFIRNYANLGLNFVDKNLDIINKENKYFLTIGKLLGFLVKSKKNNDGSIEIDWKEYEFNTVSTSLTKINIVREIDLTKDLSVIYDLTHKVKKNPHIGYVLILEVSSYNRIDFLNKIVKSSLDIITDEILIIYITRDVIKNIFYFNAYLFKNSDIIKNKVGISSSDDDGKLKAIF